MSSVKSRNATSYVGADRPMSHSGLLDVTVRTDTVSGVGRGFRGCSDPFRLIRCVVCFFPLNQCCCPVKGDCCGL